jgi:putative endonuclease
MTFLRRNHASRTPRQRAGDAAEQAACARLVAAGCRILARNVRFREGELDIVAQDGTTIVFVEVRMRSSERFGGAAASVDRFKQRRLVRAAQEFLARSYGQRTSASRPAEWPACRFDVVATDSSGEIEWIKDAFSES